MGSNFVRWGWKKMVSIGRNYGHKMGNSFENHNMPNWKTRVEKRSENKVWNELHELQRIHQKIFTKSKYIVSLCVSIFPIFFGYLIFAAIFLSNTFCTTVFFFFFVFGHRKKIKLKRKDNCVQFSFVVKLTFEFQSSMLRLHFFLLCSANYFYSLPY